MQSDPRTAEPTSGRRGKQGLHFPRYAREQQIFFLNNPISRIHASKKTMPEAAHSAAEKSTLTSDVLTPYFSAFVRFFRVPTAHSRVRSPPVPFIKKLRRVCSCSPQQRYFRSDFRRKARRAEARLARLVYLKIDMIASTTVSRTPAVFSSI